MAATTRTGPGVRGLGERVEVVDRLGPNDRVIADNWLRRHSSFPRPIVTLAIGHVWS